MNLPWVQQIGAVLPWRRTALFCGLTVRNTGWMYCYRCHDSAGSFAGSVFVLIAHFVPPYCLTSLKSTENTGFFEQISNKSVNA